MNHTDINVPLDPAIIVIFGVTGDLARRKLLPALYELQKNHLLHDTTRIVGIIRRKYTIETLLEDTQASIQAKGDVVDLQVLTALAKKIELFEMDPARADGYDDLRQRLDVIESNTNVCMTRLYYLAVPPQISTPIITHLGEHELNDKCEHGKMPRLLMEKPFGYDTTTARALIDLTRRYFTEAQLFRIDHYLAKETVQNIMAFRFHNPLFEDVWNASHITAITLAADEKLDIEGRANFYENVGALRDLVQSHLINVLSVVLMDRPLDATSSEAIHIERQRALDAIDTMPIDDIANHVIRGQYEGYRDEVQNPNSHVETFAALKLSSHLPQWQGVPIYIRTGKALAAKQTSVSIEFTSEIIDTEHTNQLIFHVQPNEGITAKLWIKKPGFGEELQLTSMHLDYEPVFATHGHPEAYERVFVDAKRGDNTLFSTSEEVLASWRILQPVLDAWAQNTNDVISYAKGSGGPDLTSITE